MPRRRSLTTFVLLFAAGGTLSVSGQTSEARLTSLGESVQIGQLEGPEESVLGLIEDGVLGPDYLFLADSRFQQIRKYSFSGRLLGQTGRGGRGPGEFYVLTSLAPMPNGRLAVLDAGNRRITVYSPDLELEYEIPLSGLYSDVCAMGDRLFVQGYLDDSTIHEISFASKRVIRSFGTPPAALDAPPALAASAMRTSSDAALVCDQERNLIIEAHRSTRTVRGFATDGTMLWEATLPGYREVTRQMTKRGTLAMVPDPETNTQHYLASAALLDPDHMLIQHAVISYRTPEVDSGELDAWEVDLTNGAVRRVAPTLPRFLDRAFGKSLYAANLPFPQARIVTDAARREGR